MIILRGGEESGFSRGGFEGGGGTEDWRGCYGKAKGKALQGGDDPRGERTPYLDAGKFSRGWREGTTTSGERKGRIFSRRDGGDASQSLGSGQKGGGGNKR